MPLLRLSKKKNGNPCESVAWHGTGLATSYGPQIGYPLQYAPPQKTVAVHQLYEPYGTTEAQEKDLVKQSSEALVRLGLGSLVSLPNMLGDLSVLVTSRPALANQRMTLYDELLSRLNIVLTLVDGDRYNDSIVAAHGLPVPGSLAPLDKELTCGHRKQRSVAMLLSSNYLAKVNHYANSKLPPNLPPMRLYIATYPLLTLAAKYSNNVYQKPQSSERSFHIDADWRAGTKAMIIKSVPMDSANTIVFAIRGTASFMDWAVNLNMAPTSPKGILDDWGNLCHAGFLSATRKIIRPVAQRLRQLLEEDPSRSSHSLLITGHSAGGAVAALLYSHMLSVSDLASSELNLLTGCFRRIHCITFGTPPVTLIPLTKPARHGLESSLFFSFVNEGDPVVRADKAYIKSLINLFSSTTQASGSIVPNLSKGSNEPRREATAASLLPYKSTKESRLPKSHKPKPNGTLNSYHGNRKSKHTSSGHSGTHESSKNVWHVPPATLSNAGRLVLLRSGDYHVQLAEGNTIEERLDKGVVAQFTTDEQLRGVIWGDPICHAMDLYAGRIETLAIGAVMAKAS